MNRGGKGCGPRLTDLLTREEFERMRLKDGLSYREIGDRLGYSKYAIAKFARDCGSNLRHGRDIVQAYREMLLTADDGSSPAWLVAAEIGCGENLVRKVRKERGMTDYVRYAPVDTAKCPRCEFPPSRENPMIGAYCLWCWCDLLSDPTYVPRGQRIEYLRDFCENGVATSLGLVPVR